MLLPLLLACSGADPADSSNPDDTAAPDDSADDEPLCPGWSGLHPGVTNTRHTTAQWTREMGGDLELVEVVTLEGEAVVRTRTAIGTVPGASVDSHTVERFRCDEAGAWPIDAEHLDLYTYDEDGRVSELAYTIAYESDQPFYPRAVAVGDSVTVTVSYSINGGAAREETYPFTVHDRVDVTVAAGTYEAWEVTLPLVDERAWFADPEGLVLDHAYELTAFSGG